MRPRWLLIGLVASVALNLFLVGAGAGIVALGLRMARENAGVRPAALFWAAQPMTQPARRDTRQMLLQLRDQVRPNVTRGRELRIQAWRALAAPSPDLAAVERGLAESRQVDGAVRTRVEQAVVGHVAKLAPADRAAYANGMAREIEASRR